MSLHYCNLSISYYIIFIEVRVTHQQPQQGYYFCIAKSSHILCFLTIKIITTSLEPYSLMQLQLYTRKLEEKVDWLSELLHQEKEHSNDFIESNPINAFMILDFVLVSVMRGNTSSDLVCMPLQLILVCCVTKRVKGVGCYRLCIQQCAWTNLLIETASKFLEG